MLAGFSIKEILLNFHFLEFGLIERFYFPLSLRNTIRNIRSSHGNHLLTNFIPIL